MKKDEVKGKIAHELREFRYIFLFLAPLFVSFNVYRTYLLGQSGGHYFGVGFALVSALILSKLILIGEAIGLGRRSERKPLIASTLYKSAVFTLFYLVFHSLEGTLHGVMSGKAFLDALATEARKDRGESVSRGLVMFFAFIPFFALREIRRALGEERFHRLFFGRPRLPGWDGTRGREAA